MRRRFTAQDIADWHKDMTMGEAAEIHRNRGWACACVGPPWPSPPGTPCFCRLTWNHVERLQRAAHITVKLFADYVSKESR